MTLAPGQLAGGPVTDAELPALLDSVRGIAARRAAQFDVRVESLERLEYAWSRGALRAAGTSRLAGVGVRIWVDGHAGFASCHTSEPRALDDMVERARGIAETNARRGGTTFAYTPLPAARVTYEPRAREDPFSASPAKIAELLSRAESAALAVEPGLHVRSALACTRRRVHYADAGGRTAEVGFLQSTLMAYAVHRASARLGDGQEWIGGERGLADFGDDGPEATGTAAAQNALESSVAKPAPTGRHRVLCDNRLSGLLAHESFGHLTEYDLVAMQWSRLNGRLGEKFAPETVSIVDAPVVEASPRDGVAIPVDDESVEGRPVRVLDHGTLAHWLHVRGSGALEGHEPTGNGRALNARWAPIVRMRNTYFEPGELDVAEALETLGNGVYLIGGRGGAPSSAGDFMFTAIRGYLVRNGRLAEPIRPTAISGNILEFLSNVEALTRDFHVTTTNFGGCGKWGQSYIPIGMGGPHVLVADAQLGGSE